MPAPLRSTVFRLLAGAMLTNGIVASGNINRNLVDMPAWREVGAIGWAAFSRRADVLSRRKLLAP
jgi:hypothetical protein